MKPPLQKPGSDSPTAKPDYTPRKPSHTPYSRPHLCNTTFDAISVIRGDLFAFKGKYLWWLSSVSLMKEPFDLKRMWNDSELEYVDAVYEREDKKIVFFSGPRFWLFSGRTKEYGYPRPLTDLGLPPDLKRIDAAMVWGHNGKTYLFSGSQYWRYEESEGKVELDYPRDMSTWRGVPYHIDTAFKFTDGITYFFKGKKYYEFNDHRMKVDHKKFQKLKKIPWYGFGCPNKTEEEAHEESEEESEEDEDQKKDRIFVDSTSSASSVNAVSLVIVVIELIIFKNGLMIFKF